jgi:hypothetical protein
MTHILLTGAGFGKNWGGLLADEFIRHLLMTPEIRADQELRKLLVRNAAEGFESAVERLQNEAEADLGSDIKRRRRDAMQSAVRGVFKEMNEAFFRRTDFESHNNREGTIRGFLTRFDAIFTLNQDLLLEHHYHDTFDISLERPAHWNGLQIPGMQRLPVDQPMFDKSWARAQWQPLPDSEFRIEPRSQPYIKLHGSSNWISSKGNPLLIIGGSKEQEIQRHKILSRYALEFRNRLMQPGAKLMVIGYGFQDHHVNRLIGQAAFQNDLQMFVVSPDGLKLASVLSSQVHEGIPLMVYGYDLEAIFEKSIVGFSELPLRETFGTDGVERMLLMRFFDP